MQIPAGKEAEFEGIIDLVEQKLLVFDEQSLGQDVEYREIPARYAEEFTAAHMMLLEKLADFDEEIMEKYLSDTPVVDAKGEVVTRKSDVKEGFAGLVFKLMFDSFVENLAFLRVYSGKVAVGDKVYNPVKKKQEKIAKIMRLHANKREEVNEVSAGDIAALVGLKFTTTGDTLCAKGEHIVLDSMDFPEPVIGVAIEPQSKAEEGCLQGDGDGRQPCRGTV